MHQVGAVGLLDNLGQDRIIGDGRVGRDGGTIQLRDPFRAGVEGDPGSFSDELTYSRRGSLPYHALILGSACGATGDRFPLCGGI
ncbi:hypothetical protein I547_3785 [Mycobacterium kansasii 824]|nr:hypothetical protein I547_3785 [Mycobacterium kansasii 824]